MSGAREDRQGQALPYAGPSGRRPSDAGTSQADAPPHGEFVAAYRAGRAKVSIERRRAADFVAARMLLPLFLLPIFGGAVAAALLKHIVWGALLFALALLLRAAVRASAHNFVLARALEDAASYRNACAAGILRVELVQAPDARSGGDA